MNIYIYIMRIIYVHDDVDVSAYEYVNVYADDNGYVYKYLCMYELENENWFARLQIYFKNENPKSELIFTIGKSKLKISIDKSIYMCYNPVTNLISR